MYLIHAARTIYLCDEDETRAAYPDVTRRAKRQPFPGLGTLVESTGRKNKTQVWLWCPRDYATDSRGRRVTTVRETVSLRGDSSNSQVRRIGEEDLARLAHYDELIAERQAALNVARDERKDFVSKAWRRANKTVGASELERLVARTEERNAARSAA